MGQYSPSVGARVAIHAPRIAPHPQLTGFNAPPGYETSVSIAPTRIQRLSSPYPGNCTSIHNGGVYFWDSFELRFTHSATHPKCFTVRVHSPTLITTSPPHLWTTAYKNANSLAFDTSSTRHAIVFRVQISATFINTALATASTVMETTIVH